MTEKELAICQTLGTSTLCVYTYLRAFPRSRNMDIEADLGMSHRTVSDSLRKLKRTNIITRKPIKNRVMEVTILPEETWNLH